MVESESGVVRFRLWQPNHSGKNQWAVDNLRIVPDLQAMSLQADFAVSVSLFLLCLTISFVIPPCTITLTP